MIKLNLTPQNKQEEPGENFKKNDGLSEKSRADGQQEKNEPSHD